MNDNRYIKEFDKKSFHPINIIEIENKFNATYIGEFCIRSANNWTENPISIFYNPNPRTELGHSNYFGIFADEYGSIKITNGISAFVEPIIGAVAANGEVIYSRYRHDCVYSEDGSISIDGGRDYTKISGIDVELVQLIINKNKLIIKN